MVVESEGDKHGGRTTGRPDNPLPRGRAQRTSRSHVLAGDVLAHTAENGRIVQCYRADHQRAFEKHLLIRRTDRDVNHSEISNSSTRRFSPGIKRNLFLQSRRNHRRRIPRQQQTGHTIPPMGHRHPTRIHRQGIRPQRRHAQERQTVRRRLFRGTARPHPRHPHQRASVLAEGHRPVQRGQLRL